MPLLRYRMDYRDLRRLSRQFWHRHRPTWSFVREYDPGLWADVWETLREAHRLRWTLEGAIVREFPEMRDAAAQAQVIWVRDRGAQTSPVPGRSAGTVRVHTRSTQTSPVPSRDAEIQAGNVRRGTSPEGAPAGGCWNCGSLQHGYAQCGRPRREPFCFGCGERGATVRTCPRCGPVYERSEPYSAPRGPRDRQRPAGGMTTRGAPY